MKRIGMIFLTVVLALTQSAAYSQSIFDPDRSGEAKYPSATAVVQADPVPALEYQVGVGDVLDIHIVKPVTIESTVIVAPDGRITVPYIGNVLVKGMSLPDIQDQVQKRLAEGYMKFPVVSISLREMRSKKFFVYGDVMKPGTYPGDDDMTILRAITAAGGFVVSGSTGRVKLLRPKIQTSEFETIVESDIAAILNGANQNVPVLPGDTIAVSVDKFFVYGQVVRPGAYPVEENMAVLRAITVSGGFAVSGSTGRIKILRPKPGSDEVEVIAVDIMDILNGVKQNVIVLPNDTVTVTVDKFFVYGQVIRPGPYPVEANMTLLHAITVAGGFIESGAMGKVKLFRPKAGSNEFEVVESDIKSILTGVSKNVTVLPGDTVVVTADKFYVSGRVVRPGAYAAEENMTVLNAINMAGGFVDLNTEGTVKLLRQKAAGVEGKVIESDISSILSGAQPEVPVLAGDTIVVSADKFFVYGEVMRPGVYPFETSTTPLTAIAMAGGFTKFGSAGHIKVLRVKEKSGAYTTIKLKSNEVMSGASGSDTRLKPGDILVVSQGVF